MFWHLCSKNPWGETPEGKWSVCQDSKNQGCHLWEFVLDSCGSWNNTKQGRQSSGEPRPGMASWLLQLEHTQLVNATDGTVFCLEGERGLQEGTVDDMSAQEMGGSGKQ